MASKQEQESKGDYVPEDRHAKYRDKCDVCHERVGSFWGATSVVCCTDPGCRAEMDRRWDESMGRTTEQRTEDDDAERHGYFCRVCGARNCEH